jgi:DNA-binding sugar fermentation-stimulating protein
VKAVTHAADGTPASVVFVAMRPDAEVVRPSRAIDPAFADELAAARDVGVGVHGLGTAFDLPV